MDQDNAISMGPDAHVIGTKSWVAYAGTAVLGALLFFGLLPLAFLWNQIAAFAVLVVSAVIVAYRIFDLRSVQLYYDDIGVWVQEGILPWKKGVRGVKWRDMDDATFEQGFWSWISQSYTVRIRHRFTKDSEITLTDIGGGKDVVGTLRERHQQLIREGKVA